MANHSQPCECNTRAGALPSYSCTTRNELKCKIIEAYLIGNIHVVDHLNSNRSISKSGFWSAHGISKKTILGWKTNLEKTELVDSKRNELKLNYAFYFALFTESSLIGALSFMAIAGHPYEAWPGNHPKSKTAKARCFNVLRFVYQNLQSDNDSSNAGLERILLADEYINVHEPSLLDDLLG